MRLTPRRIHEAVEWLTANVIAAEDINDPAPQSVYDLFEWLAPGVFARIKAEVNGVSNTDRMRRFG